MRQFGSIVFSTLIISDVSKYSSKEVPVNLNPILNYTYYLHRPNSDFTGSITKENLDERERKFLVRIKIKSAINLISPFLIAGQSINLANDLKMNFNFNYLLTPFGQLYEQKVYLHFKKENVGIFFRQFENYYNVGFGITAKHYNKKILPGFYSNMELSYFRQPLSQQYYTKIFKNGFSINQSFLLAPFLNSNKLDLFQLRFGFLAKTYGYIPESFSLERETTFYFGLRFNLF